MSWLVACSLLNQKKKLPFATFVATLDGKARFWRFDRFDECDHLTSAAVLMKTGKCACFLKSWGSIRNVMLSYLAMSVDVSHQHFSISGMSTYPGNCPPPQKPPNNLRVIGSFYGSIRSQSQHPTRTQVLVAALGLGYTGWNIIQSSARPSSILPLIETGFGTHFSHPFVALLCASSSHSACWFSITLNVNEVRTWNKKRSQDSPKVRKEHTYGVPSAPTTNINTSPVLVLGCQTLHPGTSSALCCMSYSICSMHYHSTDFAACRNFLTFKFQKQFFIIGWQSCYY